MKKVLKRSLVVFLIGIFLTIPVMAKGHNGFHANDDLTLEKKIASTLFAAGNNVEVSSEVDGAAFVAGNNLTLSSKQDILFAAGNSIELKNVETKDAFIAGSKINIDNSYIRDLYIAADTIRIDSDVNRNVYLGGNKVTINGYIGGDCYISADNIRIGKEAQITGTLKYPEDSKISISETAIVNKEETYKGKNFDVKISMKEMIMTYILAKLLSFLSLLVTALIVFAVARKIFKKMEKMDFDFTSGVKHFVIGFLSLIAIPVASIMVMITIIGIPIAIITLIMYGISLYLSSVATSYYLGHHLFKDKIKNDYLVLVISLLLLFILKLIPIIGGFVSLISLCMGLGLYLQVLKKSAK